MTADRKAILIFLGVSIAALGVAFAYNYQKVTTDMAAVQAGQEWAKSALEMNKPGSLDVPKEATVTDEWQTLSTLMTYVAGGAVHLRHVCKGERVIWGNDRYTLCIGVNRLYGSFTPTNSKSGTEFLLDERVSKKAFSQFEDVLYDGPALMSLQPVFYEESLYDEGYSPKDVVVSYATDPSYSGGEGVGSISEPISHLIVTDRLGKPDGFRELHHIPRYNPPVYGAVGKAVWVDGPVCSGAACTMDPETMQLYDIYKDASVRLSTQKATLGYATEDWNAPDKKYRLWSKYEWDDLTTVEADIIETDGTTTTFRVKVQ